MGKGEGGRGKLDQPYPTRCLRPPPTSLFYILAHLVERKVPRGLAHALRLVLRSLFRLGADASALRGALRSLKRLLTSPIPDGLGTTALGVAF